MDTTQKVFNAVQLLTRYINRHPQTDRDLAELLNILTNLYVQEARL